jgi:hypothetical protein
MSEYVSMVEIKMCASNGSTYQEQKRIFNLTCVSDAISLYDQIGKLMDTALTGSPVPTIATE